VENLVLFSSIKIYNAAAQNPTCVIFLLQIAGILNVKDLSVFFPPFSFSLPISFG